MCKINSRNNLPSTTALLIVISSLNFLLMLALLFITLGYMLKGDAF